MSITLHKLNVNINKEDVVLLPKIQFSARDQNTQTIKAIGQRMADNNQQSHL